MSQKRKRGGQEERRGGSNNNSKQQERTDLDRLVRCIGTTLRRVGKVAKAHETLKIVKRLKQQHIQHEKLEAVVLDDADDKKKLIHKSNKKVESLERKLLHMKQFDMDVLLRLCMTRLGLSLLSVDIDSAVSASLSSSNNKRVAATSITSIGTTSKSTAVETPGETTTTILAEATAPTNGDTSNTNSVTSNANIINEDIVETLLLHKNLAISMDMLNKRITQYRKDVRRAAGEEIPGEDRIVYRRDRKKAQDQQTQQQQWSKSSSSVKKLRHDGSTNMFIDSLSGEAPADDYHNTYSQSGATTAPDEVKNRPGQRARKAKAMILEAKKDGKKWDSSVNWRAPKKRIQNETTEEAAAIVVTTTVVAASGLIANKHIKAAEVADMGKNWKNEGKAHPSWAAKQHAKQSHGIAEFKGKKITF